ncbi:hypothetical protein SP_0934 [Streptococcus pneumoniae TIGR4]|uniref:Uncharacterized protein n=1 Tax=Streptococcus pneumoniae serotype 4 (strain ATCC BAA-334 / TIGR4) TaxID=170187 RepID=A0A0H2UPU2_STRPN|nr:hypothetical protein SP_0934 [Streptococcus pneumoniae TIGR4]
MTASFMVAEMRRHKKIVTNPYFFDRIEVVKKK